MTGISAPHLSRVEGGERFLRHVKLQRVATALGVKPSELGPPEEVSNDLAPYAPPKGSALATAIEGTSQRIYRVLTNVVSEINITAGIPVIVDCSESALKNLVTGQCIVASYRPSKDSSEFLILRQYIAPKLLITNSLIEEARPLHLSKGGVRIIGVVLT